MATWLGVYEIILNLNDHRILAWINSKLQFILPADEEESREENLTDLNTNDFEMVDHVSWGIGN